MAQAQMRWLLSVLSVLGAFVYLGREPLALATQAQPRMRGILDPAGRPSRPRGTAPTACSVSRRRLRWCPTLSRAGGARFSSRVWWGSGNLT